jgi:hypothetical protein
MSLTSITSISCAPATRAPDQVSLHVAADAGDNLCQSTKLTELRTINTGRHQLVTSFIRRQIRFALLVLRLRPYLPDSFLGDFLFRVARSNFAEVGGRIALLITTSFAVVPFP